MWADSRRLLSLAARASYSLLAAGTCGLIISNTCGSLESWAGLGFWLGRGADGGARGRPGGVMEFGSVVQIYQNLTTDRPPSISLSFARSCIRTERHVDPRAPDFNDLIFIPIASCAKYVLCLRYQKNEAYVSYGSNRSERIHYYPMCSNFSRLNKTRILLFTA
jgi:hypothetical protein